MNKIYGFLLLLIWQTSVVIPMLADSSPRPCIYTRAEEQPLVWDKIKAEAWAATAWNRVVDYVRPYMEQNRKEPQWLVSRLAMYWKEGEHYTQCYLKEGVWEDGTKGAFPLVKNQQWGYGTGNAPVPTVRFPGMRTWNQYSNVPLRDRIPYNETGDMLGYSNRNPDKVIKVPYRDTGHMIRSNNSEILDIALQAAFVYFMTGDEEYAKLAANVFYPWLMGTYYMNPILDPEQCTGGPGGYAPGGFCGFYDYESIHDDLQTKAAPIYDFLYDYLEKHPYQPLLDTGKNLKEVCGEVFKKFINVSMVRLGNTDNWNIYAWKMIIPSILALETNAYYADGKGREYYLEFFTKKTTTYHEAIPDIMKRYDAVTGLWPESPGYSFGTIEAIISLALPVYQAGYDILEDNFMIEKAAFSIFPWMDARGNVIVFGDGRGGAANYGYFENLLTYYTWKNDSANIKLMKSIIQKGIDAGTYSRKNVDWKGLIYHVSECNSKHTYANPMRMSYSPAHLMITMKNGDDVDNGLMAVLYGGGPGGKHMSANGLAMQLYGFGWALAPDASGYESYWSPDYIYHQTASGANTIVPGYVRGPIEINAMEPYVPDSTYTNPHSISASCQFADVSANEKRRLLGIIRTSDSTGYYVDIFRSDLMTNDYIYHNLGDTLSLEGGGTLLQLHPADAIEYPVLDADFKADNSGKNYGDGYTYFKTPKKIDWNSDFMAEWFVRGHGGIKMNMWMAGEKNREIYVVYPPKSANKTELGKIAETPTVIVRQKDKNGWKHPFISVFEPYRGDKSLQKIVVLHQDTAFIALQVESGRSFGNKTLHKEIILNSVDERMHKIHSEGQFKGIYGVISENEEGLQYLYLGRGFFLQNGEASIVSNVPASACLFKKEGTWYYSSDTRVTITISGRTVDVNPGYNRILFGGMREKS